MYPERCTSGISSIPKARRLSSIAVQNRELNAEGRGFQIRGPLVQSQILFTTLKHRRTGSDSICGLQQTWKLAGTGKRRADHNHALGENAIKTALPHVAG